MGHPNPNQITKPQSTIEQKRQWQTDAGGEDTGRAEATEATEAASNQAFNKLKNRANNTYNANNP